MRYALMVESIENCCFPEDACFFFLSRFSPLHIHTLYLSFSHIVLYIHRIPNTEWIFYMFFTRYMYVICWLFAVRVCFVSYHHCLPSSHRPYVTCYVYACAQTQHLCVQMLNHVLYESFLEFIGCVVYVYMCILFYMGFTKAHTTYIPIWTIWTLNIYTHYIWYSNWMCHVPPLYHYYYPRSFNVRHIRHTIDLIFPYISSYISYLHFVYSISKLCVSSFRMVGAFFILFCLRFVRFSYFTHSQYIVKMKITSPLVGLSPPKNKKR